MLGNKAHWTIRSRAVPNDRGDLPNAFNLSPSQLAQRHIVHTDLNSDELVYRSSSLSQPVPPFEDPKLFQPARQPAPLSSSYAATCAAPFVCLYSLLDVHVGIWGVQRIAEEYIARELTAVWSRLLRLVWCWQDDWRSRSWQQECDVEQADARGVAGEGQNEAEKRVAADGWQRYLSELQRNGTVMSGTGFGVADGRGGTGVPMDGGGGDGRWPKRTLTDVVNKWKMRSRL